MGKVVSYVGMGRKPLSLADLIDKNAIEEKPTDEKPKKKLHSLKKLCYIPLMMIYGTKDNCEEALRRQATELAEKELLQMLPEDIRWNGMWQISYDPWVETTTDQRRRIELHYFE